MSDTRTMTMTLPDFLLARIDETEAEVSYWMPDTPYDHPGDDGYAVSSRMQDLAVCVTADCEAKRRIVDLRHMLEPAGRSVLKRIQDPGKAEMLVTVLQLLAEPYADHPDYQQEWRV